jgi:hypothetical protein
MSPQPKACPGCGEAYGRGFNQDYSQSRVIGVVYGDPKTFGQQAELNAKRTGKERMQQMAEEDARRLSGYTGPLPPGASINTTGTGETPPWRDGSMGLAPLEKPLDLTKVKDVNKYVRTGEKA